MMNQLLRLILLGCSKSCYGRTEMPGLRANASEQKRCTPYNHGRDINVFGASQGYNQKTTEQIRQTTPRYSGNKDVQNRTEDRKCLMTDSCGFTGDMRKSR